MVARRFGVSRWTVNRYLKRAADGKLAASKPPGCPPSLDEAGLELLQKQAKAPQDWTLEQQAEALTKASGISLEILYWQLFQAAWHPYKKRCSSLRSAMKKLESGSRT